MAMRTIRARVHEGRLEPFEKLALPEGAEVSMHFETPAGSPQVLAAAIRALPDLEPGDIEELERSIEAGKPAVPSDGVFDRKQQA